MVGIYKFVGVLPARAKRQRKRKGAGQYEEQRLTMYVSLHSPCPSVALSALYDGHPSLGQDLRYA